MNKINIASEKTFDRVLKYIDDHGFGIPRMPLSKHLSKDQFEKNYYDKSELISFCREYGMPSSGSKQDLARRVGEYLLNGRITPQQTTRKSKTYDSDCEINLNTQVVNYKSDPKTRAFFKKHINEFTGFSALVQKQIKQRLQNGDVFTYAEALSMHVKMLRQKKDAKRSGKVIPVAHDSCQYNQFAIDYKKDLNSKPHNLMDAWYLIRSTLGEHTYDRYKSRIREIQILTDK